LRLATPGQGEALEGKLYHPMDKPYDYRESYRYKTNQLLELTYNFTVFTVKILKF
jgi:hypothetical protein